MLITADFSSWSVRVRWKISGYWHCKIFKQPPRTWRSSLSAVRKSFAKSRKWCSPADPAWWQSCSRRRTHRWRKHWCRCNCHGPESAPESRDSCRKEHSCRSDSWLCSPRYFQWPPSGGCRLGTILFAEKLGWWNISTGKEWNISVLLDIALLACKYRHSRSMAAWDFQRWLRVTFDQFQCRQSTPARWGHGTGRCIVSRIKNHMNLGFSSSTFMKYFIRKLWQLISDWHLSKLDEQTFHK